MRYTPVIMTGSFETPARRLTGPRIKTALHCHTVNSDGGLSPRETAEQYRAGGFGALCITDHRHVTPLEEYALDGLACLPGTENGGWPDIIGVGVQSPVDRELPLVERARQLADQGGFTIAAHPTYCEAVPESYLDCEHLMALEILNAYCDSAYANGLATELWDMVLGQGKRVWGVAADDAHLNPRKRHYSAAGEAWVEAFCSTATADDVLEALKAGAFFSTQGPAFEQIAVEDQTIRVTTSPVAQVRWRTFGKAGYVHHAPSGGRIESSELPEWFRPKRFVRVELVDETGRRAWSNPVFVDGSDEVDA